jgi:hypothetical protein
MLSISKGATQRNLHTDQPPDHFTIQIFKLRTDSNIIQILELAILY